MTTTIGPTEIPPAPPAGCVWVWAGMQGRRLKLVEVEVGTDGTLPSVPGHTWTCRRFGTEKVYATRGEPFTAGVGDG
jgi:hypothetical protein